MARLTGLSADTIRIWERRYNAVTPKRSSNGTRLYAEADVKRLSLLAGRVARGERISNLAALSNEELSNLAAPGPDRFPRTQDPLSQLLDYQTELRQKLTQEAVAASLSRSAASGALVGALFAQAAQSVALGLSTDYASVLEMDSSADHLIFRAVAGVDAPLDAHFPVDETSHAGYAMMLNKTVIMKDRQREKRFTVHRGFRALPIVSGIALPFRSERKALVLTAHTTSLREFTVDDIVFLESIAEVIIAAADHAYAYEQLQHANVHLSALLRSIDDLFFVVDETGCITYANDTFLQNLDPAPVVGAFAPDVVPHLSEPHYRRQFDAALRTGRRVRYEVFSTSSQTWYEGDIHPVEGGFAVYYHDISLRKINEFARSGKNTLYKTLLTHLPGAVWITDADSRILSVNGKLTRMLGFEKKALVNHTISEAFCASALAAMLPAYQRALRGQASELDVDCRGTQVRLFISPLREAGIEPSGMMTFALALAPSSPPPDS